MDPLTSVYTIFFFFFVTRLWVPADEQFWSPSYRGSWSRSEVDPHLRWTMARRSSLPNLPLDITGRRTVTVRFYRAAKLKTLNIFIPRSMYLKNMFFSSGSSSSGNRSPPITYSMARGAGGPGLTARADFRRYPVDSLFEFADSWLTCGKYGNSQLGWRAGGKQLRSRNDLFMSR